MCSTRGYGLKIDATFERGKKNTNTAIDLETISLAFILHIVLTLLIFLSSADSGKAEN